MHYHLEVIMPPTDDVNLALEQILAPFNESANPEIASSNRFWDWWVIGGRWHGKKAGSKDKYNSYSNTPVPGDIMRMGEVDPNITCATCIFATTERDNKTKHYAEHLVMTSIWTGCNWLETKWDGTLGSAMEDYRKKLEVYNDDARKRHMPTDDWLVVTVDYHS